MPYKFLLSEIKKWLVLICAVQLVLISIPNLLGLNPYLLEPLSTVVSIASLAFFVLFPFLLVRKEIKLSRNKKHIRGFLIGLITSFIFSMAMFILGLLGSIIHMIRGDEFITTLRTVVNGSIIGGVIMIFVGAISGWISHITYKSGDKGT